MNGMINAVAVNAIVSKALAEFADRTGGEAAGEGYRNLLTSLADIVDRAANTDLEVVAYDVVDRDMIGSNVGGLHKIQGIKDIRTVTLCGLKEAKDAWEYAVGAVLRDRANAALKALHEYNTTAATGWSGRQYVSAVNHREVLSDLEVAAETPPF